MKHFDDTTKKLIKNVAALVTSALVLIAATVAWFSANRNAYATAISSNISSSSVSVKYYRADVSADTCELGTGTISSYSIAQKAALTWTEVSNIDVNPLYPGEYNAFKITVYVNEPTTPEFIMKQISCSPSDASAVAAAYSSVYVSATAVDSSNQTIDTACDTIANLVSTVNNVTQIAPLTIGQFAQGTSFTIYLDIGIPGDDVNNTHDALRQTGAQIYIANVGMFA